MGRRCALLFAWLGCALPSPPHASASAPHWTAPEGCPTASDLQVELARMLSEPERTLGQLDVEGVVVRDSTGVHTLWLQVSSQNAREKPAVRELQSTSCQELLEAAAVAIALAADVADARPPPSVIPAVDDEKPAPQRAHEPPPASPSRATWSLGAGGWLDTAALHAASFGTELQLALTYGLLQLGFTAAWSPPHRLPVGSVYRAAFELWFGQLRPCARWPIAQLAAAYACGLFELGQIDAALQRSGTARVDTGWRAAGAGLGGSLGLSSAIALASSVDLLAPLTRAEFQIDGGSVFQSPRVTWRIRFGILLQL